MMLEPKYIDDKVNANKYYRNKNRKYKFSYKNHDPVFFVHSKFIILGNLNYLIS